MYILKNPEMDLILFQQAITKFTLPKVLKMSLQLPKEARQIHFYFHSNTNVKWLQFLA